MTTYAYKSRDEIRPLPTRVQLPVTHIVETPQHTRRIELNTTPEVIAQLLRAGWTLVEDRTVAK